MAKMADSNTLPTRVSVLEHGVQELKSGLDSHRGETRVAFTSLQQSLDRIVGDVARRANPTNWYGLIGAAAAAVVIIGSIFALAEWRVSSAFQPLYEAHKEDRAEISRARDEIMELRVRQAVTTSEGERTRIEQKERIRARVNAEEQLKK